VANFDIRVVIVFAVGIYRDLLFLYVIVNLITGLAQWSPPDWLRPALNFLHDVCEPFLRLFRNLMPGVRAGGMGLDLSPIIAFIVLTIVEAVLRRALLGF
jgi:YggT family protein